MDNIRFERGKICYQRSEECCNDLKGSELNVCCYPMVVRWEQQNVYLCRKQESFACLASPLFLGLCLAGQPAAPFASWQAVGSPTRVLFPDDRRGKPWQAHSPCFSLLHLLLAIFVGKFDIDEDFGVHPQTDIARQEAQRQPASLQETEVTKQQTNMAKRRYLLHDLFRGPEPFEGSIVPTNSTIVALTLLSKCATTIYSCGPSRSPRLELYSSRHCHCCTTSIESNVDTRKRDGAAQH